MDFREITEFFRDFIGYIILLVVIIVIFTFVIAFHPIAGNSMVPTLEEGSIVLVSKFHPNIIDIKRGHIVIVKKDHKSFIKTIARQHRNKLIPRNHIIINSTIYISKHMFKCIFIMKQNFLTNIKHFAHLLINFSICFFYKIIGNIFARLY